MISNKRLTVLLLAALSLTAACAGDGSDGDAGSTETLTRDLLAQPATDGQSTPMAVDPALAREGERVMVSSVGFDRGAREAPVKVLELSDYGCGYCRRFHQETFPTLVDQFIETGMVEWKFVPFVTGMFENSVVATESVECTYAQSPEAFEALNRRMWDEQSVWKSSDEPGEVVRGWVSELGIDMNAFDTCVADDEQLGRVASSTTLAQQIGVRGTPTFIVLGYPPLQGALPTEVFQQVLTAVYAESVRQEGQAGQGQGAGPTGGSPPDSGDAPDTGGDPGA